MRNWATTQAKNNSRHDTVRLEELKDLAWEECKRALAGLDRRFALQLLRSLGPKLVEGVIGVPLDSEQDLLRLSEIATSAALQPNGVDWKVKQHGSGSLLTIDVSTFEHDVAPILPEKIGKFYGAGYLLMQTEIWYRFCGKGATIVEIPLPAEFQWTMLETRRPPFAPRKLKIYVPESVSAAIDEYEARRDSSHNVRSLSGLIKDDTSQLQHANMLPGLARAAPNLGSNIWFEEPISAIQVKGNGHSVDDLNWWAMPELRYISWIEKLRLQEAALVEKTGLTCDELSQAFSALAELVHEQSQCFTIKPSKGKENILNWDNLESEPIRLSRWMHSVSVYKRGYLRTSQSNFVEHLTRKLAKRGANESTKLVSKFVDAFSGVPNPKEMVSPKFFWLIDEVTLVIDLTQIHKCFVSLFQICSVDEGEASNARGALFEEECRKLISKALKGRISFLDQSGKTLVKNGRDFGDVDFAFVTDDGLLVNLDMKSRYISNEYLIGHYHTIDNRNKVLARQMERVIERGNVLEERVKQEGKRITARADRLIVASPEYLSPSYRNLWSEDLPGVITADELIDQINDMIT